MKACQNCIAYEAGRCISEDSPYCGREVKAWASCRQYEAAPPPPPRWRPSTSRKYPDLVPEPNGVAYRRLLGGEPGGPMTMAEAEAEIGRAIDGASRLSRNQPVD